MSQQTAQRYGIDSYLDWIKEEGVPITDGNYAVNLFDVETGAWPRFGLKGAAVHLQGRGDFNCEFLFEIPPGSSSTPIRHLYEDVYYVLEGNGSTQIEFPDGRKRSFEWGPRAMFAVPINTKHRHFNASGHSRALLVSTNNMPLLMNTFHDERFIFENDFDFSAREGKANYYSGEGDFIPIRPGNHLWETNFVPDLASIELHSYADRGGGSSNIKFVLADGIMSGHMSEMPVGTYKKAHRHGSGTHVISVTGHGYSLLWYEGDKDFTRIDWQHGVVFPPCNQQIHQHFNTSSEPARYLAIGIGNVRYPFTNQKRNTMIGEKGARQKSSLSIKEGGNQIEYEDQDLRIHALWLDEMKKNGITPRMDKYFPGSQAA
jgi:mannose-6-phosphate isomerase-like protein (cupin superfamily)